MGAVETISAKNRHPIGVFDSGMGGLTVLHELMNHLPNESFIYLGDTARLPYGTKSVDTVKQYALQMAHLLVDLNIKMLVIACNTATTSALAYLQHEFPWLPIIGVVEPSARAAMKATRNKKIALLATETTIRSQGYQTLLQQLDPELEIIPQSCGLFVALAEEGSINDEIALATCQKYLTPLLSHGKPCDTIILGCTHFPVFTPTIERLLGPEVHIINSAKATAAVVKRLLEEQTLKAPDNQLATQTFLVTDLPERFLRIGQTFLGHAINADHVILVDAMRSRAPKAPRPQIDRQ